LTVLRYRFHALQVRQSPGGETENSENNREFSGFQSFSAIPDLNSQSNSNMLHTDSLFNWNRVFFSPKQGTQPSEQGIHNLQSLMSFIFSTECTEIDSTHSCFVRRDTSVICNQRGLIENRQHLRSTASAIRHNL
jgi:hypothetical protein